MKQRRRSPVMLVAAGSLALAGCRAPEPRPVPGTWVPDSAVLATERLRGLESRPLYTFSEAELDVYLRALHEARPELTERIIHLARKSIGQPYEIFLLGEFPFETYDPDPIYCLSRSDCLTFCEHIYAMALGRDWGSFLRGLQRLRYKDGRIAMLSRNHFTIADWDRNNALLFEDLTARLGGGMACVPLKQVCRRAAFFAKFGIGQEIADEPVADFYIPKANLPAILGELRDGDFVNIIRGDAASQFCGHTGLIALGDDGEVNFLHSAAPAVREERLTGYIERDPRCLGIKILRLRADAQRRMDVLLANPGQATPLDSESLEAALARWPLFAGESRPIHAQDFWSASRIQSYRLEYGTPVDPLDQELLERSDREVRAALGIGDDQRAFGLLDLATQRLALIRPDVMFYGASVPKIAIVLAYLDANPDLAGLDPHVERELQLVLKRSDNDLAAKYSQLVGLDRIQTLLQSDRYGFYDAKHGGGLWCGKHYGIDEPRTGDPLGGFSHAVTVRQCLRYFLMLEQGRLVNPNVSAKLKRLFAAPGLDFHNDNFVRGLNGRNVGVIRKNGLWEDWHLDTARVEDDRGRVYLLAGAAHHRRGQEYLARMAAAICDRLSGPPSRIPSMNQLVMHQTSGDFGAGGFRSGQLADGMRGVRLVVGGGEATYESPVIEADFKFNEVLVSWNVETPPDAGFCVDLRVGRRFDDSWSPYLRVGDWGEVVPGDTATEFEEGRIDVDYFRSDQRFDRAQYRVRATRAASREPGEAVLRIDRVALCLSDRTGIPGDSPRRRGTLPLPSRPEWRRRLPVPFRSQKWEGPELAGRVCSPTSVAMVMAYRGIDVPTHDVAAACYDPTHQIYGNWPRNIQAAYGFGVPGYLTRFSQWPEVERMIAAGQPLVISIRVNEPGGLRGAPYKTSDGHLLVLTGFDEQGDVAVNDPAADSVKTGCTVYRRADLEKVWLEATGGLAYVLLPREDRASTPLTVSE